VVNFFNYLFWGNRIINYLIFGVVLLGGVILIGILRTRLFGKLKEWFGKTVNAFDDYLLVNIEKKLVPLLYLALLYLDVQNLTLSKTVVKTFTTVGLVAFMFLSVRLLMDIMVYIMEKIWVNKEPDSSRRQAFKGIISFTKLLAWALATLLLLDNLGVKISALVAGLGFGGIAVALAAQAVLGDLFSYFTIFFDRPFEIGDFIMIGDFVGTVEHIGIKTTRLRSIGGEQVIFSNTDLTNSRVRNYKRMEQRRVVFKLGINYQTDLSLLKDIPAVIEEIVSGTTDALFDRAHFAEYGNKALVYEVVYFVIGSDYNKYMNIQQTINLRLMEEFQKREIGFASPS
jgi:small-conductance mechanosensitive channel